MIDQVTGRTGWPVQLAPGARKLLTVKASQPCSPASVWRSRFPLPSRGFPNSQSPRTYFTGTQSPLRTCTMTKASLFRPLWSVLLKLKTPEMPTNFALSR